MLNIPVRNRSKYARKRARVMNDHNKEIINKKKENNDFDTVSSYTNTNLTDTT